MTTTLATLTRDQVWQAIDEQRHQVADLLDGLTADQWRLPSLCRGWSVRDVAAHLTLQQVGALAALAGMIRYRGDVERLILQTARDRAAALDPARLVAGIRATIGSRRRNAGVTCRETLIDILVHGLDIAVPLGLELPVPPAAATAALTRMWTMRWPPPFPATRAMAGYRVVATDAAWSAGDGPEVRAPAAALLLVASGRLTAVGDLSGPGGAALAARVQATLAH